MAYGLSVYNIVDSDVTTIGQHGTPVTMHAAYPLTNIATRQVSKIAKTNANCAAFNLALTNTATGFGVNPIFAILGLPPGNSAYVITIIGSATALGNSDLFSETTTMSLPSVASDPSRLEFTFGCFLKIASATSPLYVVIEISCAGSVPLEIGRVWAGPSVVATERNESFVGGLLLNGSNATSAGGQAYGAPAKSLRQFQASFYGLTDAEKQETMRALSYAGRGRPMVYMRKTEGDSTSSVVSAYRRDNSFYCHLEGEVSFTSQASRDLNTITFGAVEER